MLFIYNIFLNVEVEYVWSTKNFLPTFLLRVTRHHGHIASFNKKKGGGGRPIRNLDKPKNQLGHNIFQRKRVLFIFPIYQKPTNKKTHQFDNLLGGEGEGAEDFPFINNRQFNFNESILSPYPSLLVFIPSIGILWYFDLKKERKNKKKMF